MILKFIKHKLKQLKELKEQFITLCLFIIWLLPPPILTITSIHHYSLSKNIPTTILGITITITWLLSPIIYIKIINIVEEYQAFKQENQNEEQHQRT